MLQDFWLNRWEENRTGWHLSRANDNLIKHFSALKLKSGNRVFIPLCGKTLDIHWLLKQGFQVVGVELSELAVKQLFKNLELFPEVTQLGAFKSYHSDGLNVLVGDFFDLTATNLGPIDAIYDRAALVALPYGLLTIF